MGSFDQDKQEISGDIQGVYRWFVKLRVMTGEAMHNAETRQVVDVDNLVNGEPEQEAVFKDYLARLFDYYKFKFSRRKDVELPGFVDDVNDVDVRGLSFGEAKELYNCISELQEKLGHLSVARGTYTEEGI